MRKKISNFFLTLLEYLPIFMTIGFSGYIILQSQINYYSNNDLLLWVLSLLGLLATATLVERFGDIRKIKKFAEDTHEYLVKNERKPPIDLVFSDRKALAPLEKRLQSAKEVIITGGSLVRLVSEYLGFFEHKLKEGCSLKFLLINPDSVAAELLAQHVVYETENVFTYKEGVRASLSNLYRLKQAYPSLVEIRVCNFVPPIGLMVVDSPIDESFIQVELFTLKVPTRDRPEFTLKASREPYWYNFFLSQYKQMWTTSSVWTPKQEEKDK